MLTVWINWLICNDNGVFFHDIHNDNHLDAVRLRPSGATFDEVFNNGECPVNGSTNVRFRCREVEGNKYYEMYYKDSGNTLGFGQTRVGNKIFPRRKDKDCNLLPNEGWTKWEKPSN